MMLALWWSQAEVWGAQIGEIVQWCVELVYYPWITPRVFTLASTLQS